MDIIITATEEEVQLYDKKKVFTTVSLVGYVVLSFFVIIYN